MTNKNRAKGNRFEYRVRDVLKAEGWFVIKRPRSAFPDLIAIKAAEGGMLRSVVKLVECKVKKKYFSRGERLAIVLLADQLGATPWLAYRDDKRKVIIESVERESE